MPELILPLLLLSIGILTALGLRRTPLTPPQTSWVLALFPFAAFLSLLFSTSHLGGKVLEYSTPWIPALGLNFSLYLDGLSALFALLITGIGTLIVIYAGQYFGDDASAWRFHTYTLLFMLAMLGLVLAGDLITLFLFWEATSISSFLLIAYKFKDEAARKGAFKSLFITGGGGIAMLAGFVFMISISGGADFQTILTSGDILRGSPIYSVVFTLVALGAFTKSAQFPAHIWLPEAMSAPTPASAFLHSATMVKAGVYLLARLNPALGGTDLWFWALTIFGVTTMLVGAYLGFKQNDLKPLLAYSTISQLGVLVALIGQDTEIAFKALVISILAHALYKSALFMSAGIIDHETGTRDIRKLGGLRKQMPIMFIVITVAALSMAGLPPLFGFLAKETLLTSATHPSLPAIVGVLFPLTTVLAGAFLLAQAGLLIHGIFLAKPADSKHPPHGHDPKLWFWLAPALPALLSLLIGIAPVEPAFLANFLADAAKAAFGDKVKVSLALWTGINVPLILSIVAVTAGSLIFWQRERIRPWMMNLLPNFTMNALFDGVISGLDSLSKLATRLQRGEMRFYLRVMIVSMVILFFLFSRIPIQTFTQDLRWDLQGLNGLRAFTLIVLTISALATIKIGRDLHSIIALGITGLGVAVWMALEPSPDVALVQIVVDILATIILILGLIIIPQKLRNKANEIRHSRKGQRRDILIAGLAGVVMMAITFTALNTRPRESVVTPYYADNAKPLTGAKDIVGAIVVDFRAADTLIEIMVFAMAGLGIYTLLHFASRKGGEHSHEEEPKPHKERTPLGIHGMPTSPLLHLLAYVTMPLVLMLGVIHMMYGHDQPGDGFTAGVVISLGIAMWYIIFGYSETRRKLTWLNRNTMIALGLSLALLNAIGGAFFGAGVLAPVDYGAMLKLALPPGFYLTNSFLFEVSIALTVMGAATLILDNLGHPREEEPEAFAELASIKEQP